MEETINRYREKVAETISKKLKRRNFNPVICTTVAEAKKLAMEKIDKNKVVSFGGSVTLTQSGILEDLY